MSRDEILKLDDPSKEYKFNMEEFYQNAEDCQNSGGGDPELNVVPEFGASSALLPKCFINLQVIKAENSPCNVNFGRDFGDLGFSPAEGSCSPPFRQPPKRHLRNRNLLLKA
jgi:hypothetical protein